VDGGNANASGNGIFWVILFWYEVGFSKDFLDSVDGVGGVGLTEFFQKNIFYIFYF
jgi:hypothetical protein